MRRLKLALGLGALLTLGLATNAQALSTQATWDASSTSSAANGTKKAPKQWTGRYTLTATNNIDPSYRPATPSSWSWSWEGVVVRQKGIPSCTKEAINDAKSTAVCPPKAQIGTGPVPGAMFGPAGLAEGPNTICNGKTFDLWNGPANEFVLVIDGPPEQCGTLGFLGALPVTLATSGGKTTMTWPVPENIQNPFPGAEGALLGGDMVFNNISAKIKSGKASASAKKKKGKKKKKAKKVFLFNSINCKGPRDFSYTVNDTFGTHVINKTAGNCAKPKKAKKKKKKKK